MPYRVDRPIDHLAGLLLPPRCVLCGSRGQRPCIDLCAACERSLPVADLAGRSGPAPLELSFAPFAYAHPVDHLVHALKYRGQLATARVLGDLLLRRIEAAGLGAGIDALVPVPLHPARQAGRGFNQSAEVARWVARGLGCPVAGALASRGRDTRPQVGLGGGLRRANLEGAFAADAGARGLRIAIVDDVSTTGTTLRELGATLRAAGARSVEAWCVARAVDPMQVDSAGDEEDRWT